MKYLYLLFFITNIQISLSQSANMTLLGVWDDNSIPSNNNGQDYNECWGWAQGGREYAVIGSRIGAHIIDVTNPSSPIEVDRVHGKYTGTNVIHRDYKIHKGYLYMVCDEGNSSLQIADLSYLPDSVHVVYDSDALIVKSHNLFIDSATNRMYSCGGSKLTGGNDLRIFDVSNPVNPILLTDFKDDVSWWSSSIGYVHDIYVKNNIGYTNDGDAMHIVDFSNPSSPIILGTLSSYPDQGYNHAGWLHTNDSTYVMLDETHGKRVKFMDVSNPANILITDLEGTNTSSTAIPHNAIIKGNYAYTSYYYDGVYVFDISDKNNVTIAGFYDTYSGPDGNGFHGCWGVYPLPSGNILGSDLESGLHIFSLKKPTINFNTTSQSISEGLGTFNVNVSLSSNYADPVKVQIDLVNSSTATPGNDFTTLSAFPITLIFPPHTINQTIPLTIINDALLENNETITLNLQTPTNCAIGSSQTITITINDNEVAGINTLNKNKLKIFPNPVNSGETVNFNKPINFEVYNIAGKSLFDKVKSNKFSTNKMSTGCYFIKINNSFTKLIVK